jgi:DNA-binding CsgD family transcriptional regulator
MSRQNQSSSRNGEARFVRDKFSYDRPQVRLLSDHQWLSIRRYFHISPREMEVAKLVCGGLSNGEIATKLKIKSATVKTHLRNVYRRIHVQRKLDMLLKFLDQSAKYPLFPSAPEATVPLDVNGRINSGIKGEVTGKDDIIGP